MRLLADEYLHAEIVSWLRSAGHDVTYAAESLAGDPDEAILLRARAEDRIIVTDDKDFGDLVVHRRTATAGILLVRQREPSVAMRIARLRTLWEEIERRLPGNLVVVSDHAVRIRSLSPRNGG